MASDTAPPRYVYKVLRPLEWADFKREGRFAGSPDDLRDGFVHLSCWTQLEGTLGRHFSALHDREVVVAVIEVVAIAPDLRWERSRGGALFPHLYSELRAEHVVRSLHLARAADGPYPFPEVEPS